MITFRVLTYDKNNDLAVSSGTEEDVLAMKDSLISCLIKIKEPFKVTEDWRRGKLFDILVERFDPMQGEI